MSKTKFIRLKGDVFCFFSEKTCLNHSDYLSLRVVNKHTEKDEPEVKSAGFCYFDDENQSISFYGESITLKKSSLADDVDINDLLDDAWILFIPRQSHLVDFDTWMLTNDQEMIVGIEIWNGDVDDKNKKIIATQCGSSVLKDEELRVRIFPEDYF